MKNEKISIYGRLALAAPVALIYIFSTWPAYTYYEKDQAVVIVSFKKTTQRVQLCNETELKAFREHTRKRRKHMRRAGRVCGSRERVPLAVKIWIDGRRTLDKKIYPAGINKDGVVFIYERFALKAGTRRVKIALRDYRKNKIVDPHVFDETLTLKGRQVIVLEYDEEQSRFVVS